MNDAKEYQKVIEACTGLATVSSIQNKLNSIASSTEDAVLKRLLATAIGHLEQTYRAALSRKIHNQKSNASLQVSPFKELAAYCKDRISEKKPQWQVLAERHNWGPK